MTDQTDSQLLQAYANGRSEAAFAELVRRHVDFVYSAALRMVCDSHLAEDVTQAVFLAAARDAAALAGHRVLAGWLHRTTRNIAAQTVRTDVRRRNREHEAAAMNQLPADDSNLPWEHIAPHVDSALAELNAAERDALLLRYFQHKSAREMGLILGITEEAAQKRVSRAVERLRECFTRRGLTVAAGALVALIPANAVQAAPAGLAAAVVSATLAGTATVSTAIAATTKAITMTTLQKILVAATLAVAAGIGIYEASQAARLRTQLQSVREQQAPLTGQLQRLQRERDTATNRLALLADSISRLKGNSDELLKLRAEVTRLRNETRSLQAGGTNNAELADVKSWVDRVKAVKQRLESAPDRKIPELQFLADQDWFNAVGKTDPLETDDDFRREFAHLRDAAKEKFAHLAMGALGAYAADNGDRLPDDPLQLKAYFNPPLDDADAILSRYKMLYTGSFKDLPKENTPVMGEKVPADTMVDSYYSIGIGNYSKTSVQGFPQSNQ